jgi:hypothetical protein
MNQALSSWLLVIARQPFSSLAIDFKADLKMHYAEIAPPFPGC